MPAGKKKRTARSKKLSAEMTTTAVEDIVVKLTRDVQESELLDEIRETYKVDGTAAGKLIKEARRRLTLAARYHREREIGIAYKRINNLFADSRDAEDFRSALAAQKELNTLLALYPSPDAENRDTTSSHANSAEKAVRDHLVPLQLADESSPLEEHVRLAALRIMDQLALE